MSYKIHVISDHRSLRIRVRRVPTDWHAERAAEQAAENDGRGISVGHGGSVANCYGYYADTEGCVAVAVTIDGELHVAIYANQLAANKVTHSGVLARCLGEYARPCADERFSAQRKAEAEKMVYLLARKDIVRKLEAKTLPC